LFVGAFVLMIALREKLLDNKSVKSSCDNLEAALKKDEKSNIDANELYMELKFIQDFMPKENMGHIEIMKFLKCMILFQMQVLNI
jgi:hypothetical protein